MKLFKLFSFFGIALLIQCNPPEIKNSEFASVSRIESGTPVSVMLTSYSTTLLADSRDQTRLRIAVTESTGKEITSATDSIRIYVTGDGKIHVTYTWERQRIKHVVMDPAIFAPFPMKDGQWPDDY